MPETQVARIQCPNCGTPYEAPIRSVIDVGQNPELRQAFLAGQINAAFCPKCGQGGLLDVPLVYHDPAAEFLAVYFPPQAQVAEVERQRWIGEATQGLMRSLPPDQRKGYFLNPRQFVSRQSLMDAILGTMGISQEELDRQRKKLKMLDQLLVMADDRKGLEMMIKGQDSQFDYEFFTILSNVLAQTQAAGDEKSAQKLATLHENLLQLTSWGQRAARQQEAVESLKDVATPDQLVDKLVAAAPDEVDAIAVAARPLLDYTFFQKLSERMERSQGEERQRLTGLRDHLLDVTEKLDRAARARIEASVGLLQELLNSPNPRSAVREHVAELDDVFMAILSLNIQEAERKGDKNLSERLAMIEDEVMGMLEEGIPPEMRLVNELLRAPYPEGTRALLRERQSEVTPEVISLIDRLAKEIEEREGPDRADIAKRLRDIKAQAMLLV